MGIAPSPGAWQPLRGHIPKENCLFLSQHVHSASNSLDRCGTLIICPSSLRFYLAWSCPGLVHTATATVDSYVQLLWCVWEKMFPCRHPLPIAFLIFLLWWSLNHGTDTTNTVVFFKFFAQKNLRIGVLKGERQMEPGSGKLYKAVVVQSSKVWLAPVSEELKALQLHWLTKGLMPSQHFPFMKTFQCTC